jgi:hypothetical protein
MTEDVSHDGGELAHPETSARSRRSPAAGGIDHNGPKVVEMHFKVAPELQRGANAVDHQERWPVATNAVANGLALALDASCLYVPNRARFEALHAKTPF